MQSDPRKDGELGASIQAFNIFRRIGFSETKLLCLPESRGEGNAIALNLAENVVAGAVENAADLKQFIASQSFMQSGDHGHAAGYRSAKLNLLLPLARKTYQFGTTARDQLLVGGDHGFARCQGAPDPIFGGLKASHHLDDDIHVGG